MPRAGAPPTIRPVGGTNQEREDFAAKLALIEQQADLAAADLPPSIVRDRIQHIAVVARLLKSRLEVASGLILPPLKSQDSGEG